MNKFKTKVITNESQVPAGFTRISELASSLRDQKKLSDAHTDGLIEAVKLMRSIDDRTGPVWVDAAAAAKVLAGVPQAPAKPSHEKQSADVAIAALTEVLSAMVTNQFTLIHAIEQIADAVQRIADQQPLARMDDIAICEPAMTRTINGNPAPWNET
jgi:hypothetical protein